MGTRRRRLWILLTIPLALLSGPSDAAESELEDAPAPVSVDEIGGAMQDAFGRPARQEPLFSYLKKQLEHLPPFLSDTELKVHYRTYEFYSDPAGNGEKSEAWAMGGSIDYRSGRLWDVFSTQVKWFFSEPVRAPSGKDGTRLLKSSQRGYNVLGVANAEIRWRDYRLRAFRQEMAIPYLNRNDSRMTPNTFESVGLVDDTGSLQYGAAYTWRIKLQDTDEFLTMSEAAGVSRDRGVTCVAAFWNPSERLGFGGANHFATDLFNTFYLDASFGHAFTDELPLKLQIQFADQRSVGDVHHDPNSNQTFCPIHSHPHHIPASGTFGFQVRASSCACATEAPFSVRAAASRRPYLAIRFRRTDHQDDRRRVQGCLCPRLE